MPFTARTHIARVRASALIAVVSILCGCGVSHERDGVSSDAAGACKTRLDSCATRTFPLWQTMLKASELGPQARFLAMSRRTVLAALGDGRHEVVLFYAPSIDGGPG